MRAYENKYTKMKQKCPHLEDGLSQSMTRIGCKRNSFAHGRITGRNESICSIQVVSAVSLLTCSSQPDSAGTKFIFGFIRDADRNISNQLLSVTVLNSNTYDCYLVVDEDYDGSSGLKQFKVPATNMIEVSIPSWYGWMYDSGGMQDDRGPWQLISAKSSEDYDGSSGLKQFKVPATNMIEVSIPSWYGWMYDSGGMQDDRGPWQLISAKSSCPVTLIANNHDNATFQEDSYLVLPTTWAKYGQVYAFTLPPASSDVNQNQHISIIPTERDVKGVLKVGSDSLAFTAKFAGPTTYFMTKTPNSEPKTYKIEADGPILILAGVTCAGNYRSCDHAAFMPQPMPKSLCQSETPISENHPTFVRSYVRDINGFYGELISLFPQGFYVNIPQNCSSQMMTVLKNQYQLSDSEQTPLLSFPFFPEAVNMHVDTAPINVVRYDNGFDQGWQGTFITTVPSTNQYIRGSSSFFTKNDNDTVEVVFANNLYFHMSLDGYSIVDFALDLLPVDDTIENVDYLAAILTVPKRGFHVISSTSDGPYVYCVIGRNENSMYGYYGGLNMPVYTSPSTTTLKTTTKSPTSTVKRISSTSAPSSKTSTNIPVPSPTPRNRLTTSTAITMPSSSTITTTTSTAPPVKTPTKLPTTPSLSYSLSSFFLAILTTCLSLLL
ncbi:unnamed protein product [Cylicocyclus nassatus]|uniref:IgGFc-binding protein N-terminal domain-containing protein n=1 Tax=Cylicocyclus nassatus TaxID=53992 RepID=A0AA36MEU3_CYLNA|nr:unnamed protein product [Cylicocyclus nassatus]